MFELAADYLSAQKRAEKEAEFSPAACLPAMRFSMAERAFVFLAAARDWRDWCLKRLDLLICFQIPAVELSLPFPKAD